MQTIKCMLCVISSEYPSINFCPPLVDLLLVLLLYMEPPKVYDVVAGIIERSTEDNYYLFFDHGSFTRHIMTFESLLKRKSRRLHAHLVKLGISIPVLYMGYFCRLFVSILPLPKVCRLMDAFLNEGHNVFFRFLLNIFIKHQWDLLAIKDADALVREFNSSLLEFPLHKYDQAFKMKVTHSLANRIHHSHTHLMSCGAPRVIHFQLPSFRTHMSEIMRMSDCLGLWSWLPENLSFQDPNLLFSTSRHGHTLSSLLHHMGDRDEPSILLMQDDGDGALGVFLMHGWSNRTTTSKDINEGIGGARSGVLDSRCFVFTLSPEMRWYGLSGRHGGKELDPASDDGESPVPCLNEEESNAAGSELRELEDEMQNLSSSFSESTKTSKAVADRIERAEGPPTDLKPTMTTAAITVAGTEQIEHTSNERKHFQTTSLVVNEGHNRRSSSSSSSASSRNGTGRDVWRNRASSNRNSMRRSSSADEPIVYMRCTYDMIAIGEKVHAAHILKCFTARISGVRSNDPSDLCAVQNVASHVSAKLHLRHIYTIPRIGLF